MLGERTLAKRVVRVSATDNRLALLVCQFSAVGGGRACASKSLRVPLELYGQLHS